MTTLIAYGGRTGRWEIDVEERYLRLLFDGIGQVERYVSCDDIPVFHHTLIETATGQPYQEQFLHGFAYDQPCYGNWQRKLNQISRAKYLKGLVCLSRDNWDRRPGTPGIGGRKRHKKAGYEGLFLVTGLAMDRFRHQRFVIDQKLCDLVIPSQA